MTRRDFELIARTIKGMEHLNPTERDYVARRMATALGLEFERFDRERFLRACGVT